MGGHRGRRQRVTAMGGNRSFADTCRGDRVARGRRTRFAGTNRGGTGKGRALPAPMPVAQPKNKTAIGSRGWINAALTRRYRARRVRSAAGHPGMQDLPQLHAEARILLASSFVFLAIVVVYPAEASDRLWWMCARSWGDVMRTA